jgi:hypothetical protein
MRGGRHQAWLLAGIAILAPFLGGATERWAQAVIVGLTGLTALIFPPRHRPGKVLAGVLAALALVPLCAFFPVDFLGLPLWRLAAVQDLGIPLGTTMTPQPWLTAEEWGLWIAGLTWTYLLAASPEVGAHRWEIARGLAAGTIGLAVGALAAYAFKEHPPFWKPALGFGFFPNRNQTGNVLALGGLVTVACTVHDFRRRPSRGFFWAVGLLLIGAALVFNYSRAGIVLFMMGTLSWVAIRGWLARSHRQTVAAGAGLIFLTGLFLVYGGNTLERFQPGKYESLHDTLGYRLLIYKDTLRLMDGSNFCGVGLGNFSSVFALYRDLSQNGSRVLHPESDWLWLVAETGWLGLLAAVALGLGAAAAFPFQHKGDFSLRLMGLIGGFAFALHGMVDVSGHRMGAFWPAVLIFALAIRQESLFPAPRSAIVLRLAGGGLLVLATFWIFQAAGVVRAPGKIQVERARLLNRENLAQGNLADVSRRASEALEIAPLDWELYFQRGAAEVVRPGGEKQALADFRRARFLEPSSLRLRHREAELWMRFRQAHAVEPIVEGARLAGRSQPDEAKFLLRMATFGAESRSRLVRLPGLELWMKALFIGELEGTEFDRVLEGMLRADPKLDLLTPRERSLFFEAWSGRKGMQAVAAFVESVPERRPEAWKTLAQGLAEKRNYEMACRLVRENAPAPRLPSVSAFGSRRDLENTVILRPDDLFSAYTLYLLQKEQKDLRDGLTTLRRVTAQKEAPAYFHYLEAGACEELGRWEEAWAAWRRYLALP